ncbi:HNH endonuclease [Nocardia brasiliensis]|uniref:HNH endonuclease n=1 Tax=Nocardia brasiliensis TaxID=37326 RepID=UPI0024550C31|nr:HNH endonuclease signature motif containing protein [Nocardia brasiliensis]
MDTGQLPLPGSQELIAVLRTAELQRIYAFLYERRPDPPTMAEIEEHLRTVTGTNQSQRGRRVRDLYPYFQVDKTKDRLPRYVLVARVAAAPASVETISKRVRAQVLAPQRCAMCGRTPIDDGVRLVVDHKVPQKWGGTHDIDNLQPLCEDCNSGKKDHFKTYDQFGDKIRQAAMHDEPQRRIGALLLAFGPDEWIRSDVIDVVANAKEYQDDWERRLRDLRFLGWDYEHKKRRENGRMRTYYRLTQSAPLPDNIAAALKAEETRRRAAKRKPS